MVSQRESVPKAAISPAGCCARASKHRSGFDAHAGGVAITSIVKLNDQRTSQESSRVESKKACSKCIASTMMQRLGLWLACALAFTCQRRVPGCAFPRVTCPRFPSKPQLLGVASDAEVRSALRKWPTTLRLPRHVGADGDERLHMLQLNGCLILSSAAQLQACLGEAHAFLAYKQLPHDWTRLATSLRMNAG
jgi:hypothetical protein